MLEAGTAVGRYVIQRKLAEGGMAEIYLATATGAEGFSKEVVIKVVRPFLASDSQFVQMFIAEARLVSRLNHANIVQIFDFGKHDDTYFLAMEYVRGASLWELRKRCREQGLPFPPTLAAEIAAQVARGLHFAHQLAEGGVKVGVVHRDVTPHNILLSFDGAVKLTDFGIAKATTAHTSPGTLKGKFAYMSPEQARGDAVDARTDVFALGIVLWELLTGGRLFDGDSDVAVLRAVQESLIAPPTRLNPDVPRELSDLVMKALARPPEERFQSAGDLERALATFARRSAQSLEDTSAGHFLQQLFREEFDADTAGPVSYDLPLVAEGDSLGGLETRFLARPRRASAGTVTRTPAGGPVRSAPSRPSLLAEERRPDAEQRPATEQLPAHRPASRRLEPLAVAGPRREPAGRSSGQGFPPVPAVPGGEPSLAGPPPAHRSLLLVVVAILAGVGALGGGAAMTVFGRAATGDLVQGLTPSEPAGAARPGMGTTSEASPRAKPAVGEAEGEAGGRSAGAAAVPLGSGGAAAAPEVAAPGPLGSGGPSAAPASEAAGLLGSGGPSAGPAVAAAGSLGSRAPTAGPATGGSGGPPAAPAGASGVVPAEAGPAPAPSRAEVSAGTGPPGGAPASPPSELLRSPVAPAPGARPPGRAVRPGVLKVLVRPFGFLSLNGGRHLEVPGSKQLSLKPGRYELELFDNHEVSIKRLTVTLGPGDTQTVEADY